MYLCFFIMFFFFKQKTAYEMRISDWSSDVCSSDLDLPTLLLFRHGQSAWNLENRFTGWWDVDVTEKGAEEARAAGKLMAERGLDFDCCFTSVQTRAIKTLNLALEEMGRLWLPIEKDWHLNERHYGGLTGLN